MEDSGLVHSALHGILTVLLATNYDERRDGIQDYQIENPNFNFREFWSNLVLRWEYQFGSTFYLAWIRGRSQRVKNGGFDFFHDLKQMFDIYPDNIFQ